MNKYNYELSLDDRNSLSLLINRIKPNTTILEFGPANGRMTKYIKEQLNCRVYAVELDEEAAKDAGKYTEKIVVDSIENYSWKKEFKDIKFDYIIFADVLEHLYYPEKVLKSVREFLKEDGSILVSIPNISHNAITMGLIKNEFNYSPTGLLDDTHIRFFTKKTFDMLIERCGYYRSYETAVFMAPQNTEFGYSYSQLPDTVVDYISKLGHGEIYQLIYEFKNYKIDIESDFKEEYKKDTSKFIQLFIEDENGISEENSIKAVVEQNNEAQAFEFNVSDRENITLFRVDPLNDYCIIKINKILLNDIEIKTIQTNACYEEGNIYYFNTNDPRLYIEVPDNKKIEKLTIALEYLHIGEGALKHVVNDLLKAFTTKDQNIQSLNAELETKDQNIQSLNAELETKDQNIQSLNAELETKDQNIQNQKQELEEKEQQIQNQKQELEEKEQQIQNQKQELETKEQSIKNLNDELITQLSHIKPSSFLV